MCIGIRATWRLGVHIVAQETKLERIKRETTNSANSVCEHLNAITYLAFSLVFQYCLWSAGLQCSSLLQW